MVFSMLFWCTIIYCFFFFLFYFFLVINLVEMNFSPGKFCSGLACWVPRALGRICPTPRTPPVAAWAPWAVAPRWTATAAAATTAAAAWGAPWRLMLPRSPTARPRVAVIPRPRPTPCCCYSCDCCCCGCWWCCSCRCYCCCCCGLQSFQLCVYIYICCICVSIVWLCVRMYVCKSWLFGIRVFTNFASFNREISNSLVDWSVGCLVVWLVGSSVGWWFLDDVSLRLSRIVFGTCRAPLSNRSHKHYVYIIHDVHNIYVCCLYINSYTWIAKGGSQI